MQTPQPEVPGGLITEVEPRSLAARLGVRVGDVLLKVNGQIRQDANTGQMIWTVADIVSFLSHLMTLEPGDVIATGTPAGVGHSSSTFLKAGDVMEAEIEKIGVLRNAVKAMA